MSEILAVNDTTVKIGNDDGSVNDIPLGMIQFANPKAGDQVRVYKEGDTIFVRRVESTPTNESDTSDRRKVNKIAYILITFFLGGLGVHRFMRGQVGLGILMLLLGWLTFGIWWLVDFIISLTKLSAYPGEDYIFTSDGRFVK